MPILQDISTPAAVDLVGDTGGVVTTASFTPPANSMVVIVATIGYLSSSSAPTVTCADSAAVSYTAGPTVYDTQFEGAYIFTHFYSSSPGPITVSVTRSTQLGAALMELVPFVLTGANSSQAGAATLSFSTTTGTKNFFRSFTPTTPGSWCIVGTGIGNKQTGSPVAVGVTTDHSYSDSTDFVAACAGHFITGSPLATNMGWTWSSNSDFSWVALEILPTTGSATPALPDVAGSRDAITATVTASLAERAGAADTLAVVNLPSAVPDAETAAAVDALAVTINQAIALTDRAGAADGLVVTSQSALPLYNTFDGDANAVALTQGNSGGQSGNAFDVINTLSGGTLAGDTTRSAHGTASLKVATGVTTGTISAQWNSFPLPQGVIYFRLYLFLTASASPAWRPFAARTGANHAASVLISGTTLSMSFGSGFTGTTSFSTAVPTGAWFRIEGHFTGDAVAGEVSMSLYLTPDGTTPTETHTFSGLNTGGGLTAYQIGQLNSSASSGPFWIDEVALSATQPPGPAFYPPPVVLYPAASPAFIRSQMPRMHVQNLLTGQWVHRDVQGVNQPSVTWALNAADVFTCQLAPPRGDMMDASGNAIITEWRDAIYLEESDEIKFGGICTQSTMSGPVWTLTAMGFEGYANGMPYEGADYVVTKTDALDVVRFMWRWLQLQPGSNIGLDLGTQKAGYLLGAQVEAGITAELARDAKAGDASIWTANSQAYNRNEQITINGYGPYTITNVLRDRQNVATGQMTISPKLAEAHKQHEPVVQQTPTFTVLARDVAAGQNNVWLGTSGPFATDENITIGGDAYKITAVQTEPAGNPTGNVSITPNTRRAYAKNTTQVWQVRTITPFELHWYNSTDIGSEMGSIRDEAIFDWQERHTWADGSRNGVHHQLIFGIPRIGSRKATLRFAEGENIVQAVQVSRDGTKYANNVIGLGAGSGAQQLRVTASDLNTGRLRRTAIYTDQTAPTVTRMIARATKILTAMKNIDTVTQIVVKNHPNAPFGSYAPGDDIPVQLTQGWRNTTIWSRITQMTQDPTTDLMTLTLARSDSFSYIPDTGLAGSLLWPCPCSTPRSPP
jgi:hypothetical protein